MDLQVRKIVQIVEEVFNDGARDIATPLRLAAAIAVIKNPFAGRYEEDLDPVAKSISLELSKKLIPLASAALGAKATVFCKAALVGEAGEVQHGSSIIHTPEFGNALRAASKGHSVVPSAEKRAGTGASIDLSFRNSEDRGDLAGTDATCLFSWELRVSDAPRSDEILIVAALGNGGRPNSRLAGR